MREIKFRLVDDQNNIIENITGFECLEDGKIDGVFVDGDCYDLEENKLKLLQFTGLYDKKNVPIYEGDIINNKNILEDTNYEVIFDNGAFYGKRKNYYNPETIMYLKLYRVDKENIEVIGNIYDNEVEQ